MAARSSAEAEVASLLRVMHESVDSLDEERAMLLRGMLGAAERKASMVDCLAMAERVESRLSLVLSGQGTKSG